MSSRTRLRRRLLAWYDANARDLPWRRTRDPYAIWVSEIMLQQTRVDTVLGYYERFLARFPDARTLAQASEDAVLSAWSGLGYYRRARLLHQGVREVVARYGGQVPEDPEARRRLPGIGRYTAGAIGSIAFERPEALVDGNVARVLSRICGIDTPLGRADTERSLWTAAEQLVDGPRPGAFNQALMELGARVCTKGTPQCAACPVRSLCHAHESGLATRLPVPRARRAPRPVRCVGVVARAAGRDRGRVWLVRAERGLFAGLWNLPMGEGSGLEAARGVLAEWGLSGRFVRQRPTYLEHVLTHRHLYVELWLASAVVARHAQAVCRAVDPGALQGLGISALTRKCLDKASFVGGASSPRGKPPS